MNSFLSENSHHQMPGRVLHLCLGCSPDRLAVIPRTLERQLALLNIEALCDVLPTVFVIHERAKLSAELRHAVTPVLKSSRRSALGAPEIERYLDVASTIVVSGLEASLEVYATVSELAFFGLWQVVLPEKAILDRHPSSHGSCLHILAHGFKDCVEIAAIENLLVGSGKELAGDQEIACSRPSPDGWHHDGRRGNNRLAPDHKLVGRLAGNGRYIPTPQNNISAS